MSDNISRGLIEYYAKKKGISFAQAKYELENTYGYEDEPQDFNYEYDKTINSLANEANVNDFSIFDMENYTPYASNPFKNAFNFNNKSIFSFA